MPTIVDAQVSTRNETDPIEPDLFLSERVAHQVQEKRRSAQLPIPSTTISITFVPSIFTSPEFATFSEITCTQPEQRELRKSMNDAWSTIDDLREFYVTAVHRSTRATNPTSTTVTSASRLLRKHHRDERLRRMSPEARATYERIRKLREEIGPIDFDVVKALRELREDE